MITGACVFGRVKTCLSNYFDSLCKFELIDKTQIHKLIYIFIFRIFLDSFVQYLYYLQYCYEKLFLRPKNFKKSIKNMSHKY
ncbi:hypothetical protein BpHYR1_010545 [Brachionus plicatilis]|uniref:Uncharacterized protein n=1 Tax=Brachionus plicatilis TaxID=10195 RepID=A0A3M7T8R0_BRAPC|nr:hypothetical protein BpHYR1_010545 [Brachionus plicatilis]